MIRFGKRDEAALARAFAQDPHYTPTIPERNTALIHKFEELQKSWELQNFRKKQQQSSDRYNVQLERDRLKSHLESHRLPALHGVMARLSELERIIAQVNGTTEEVRPFA